MSNPARERELFERVLEQPPAERRAFLDRACGGEPELRRRLERLLQAHGEASATPTGSVLGLSGLLDDPTAIGPYRVLGRLGEGGMGVVLDAEQVEPIRRRVAVKIIKPGMDSRQVLRRFEAERQTLALLDHPNVARVLDAGATDTGRPYFVMEHVSGQHVTKYCDLEALGIEARLGLFLQVCDAVQHAHMKGVIHRDLKPSNVLVADRDGRPVPKVIDFGIVKVLNPEAGTVHTEHGQVVGTPQYMSPEQATGRDVDTRTDVYSLGVMLYELLTGSTPIDPSLLGGSSLPELQRAICELEPPRPSTRITGLRAATEASARLRGHEARSLARRLRGDLDWITIKALEKDRERRYSTAAELGQDVQRHLAGEPVVARPPSAPYRLGKFVRRNRVAVIAGITVAIVLTLGVIGTTAGMFWAFNEKRRADEGARQARTAEAEAVQRGEELERVAKFQETQLSKIDSQLMGLRLRQALLDAAPEKQRPALERSLMGINFTGLALETLQDNIFERTIQAVDEQFADQPLVKARLLQTLGTTQLTLGLLEPALAPQKEGLDIRRRVLGDDHPDTLTSISAVGQALHWQGKLPEAEPYYREALDKRRRVLGDDHPDTLTSISNMGELLHWQGKLPEAELYYGEALSQRRRVLGEDHPDTLMSISCLGDLLLWQGKIQEAEPHLRTALDKRRRVLGDDHPDTLTSILLLGELLQRHGKLSETEVHYREALAARRRVLGDEHFDTLMSIGRMGVLLQAQGKLAEAEPYYREALETNRRVLGDEHLTTLGSVSFMGGLLQAQGRLAEAERYHLEALATGRRVLGDEHLTTLAAISWMGSLRQAQGQFAEAERYYREVLEKLRRVQGDDAVETLSLISHMGVILRLQGRLSEAEPYTREALEKRRRLLGEEHLDTLLAMHHMGDLLQSQGKLQEADAYTRGALEEHRRLLGEDHPRTLASLNSMGALLRSQGRPADAEPYFREAFERRQRVLGDEHPDTLRSIGNLGDVLNRLERNREALDLLLSGETLARSAWSGDNVGELGNYLATIGFAQAGLGEYPTAETMFLEAQQLLGLGFGQDDERTIRCLEGLVTLSAARHAAEPEKGHDAMAAEWRARLEASRANSEKNPR